LRNTLQILSGSGLWTERFDATGKPLPCAPREGLVFELRCRGCPRTETWRIRKVNSRSFYVATWGARPRRVPLEQWESWLDALMQEGELRLVDCALARLRLIEGGAR